MKIDGDTIKFRSDFYFYNLEERGVKPNTVRILDVGEGLKVDEWQKTAFINGSVYRYIEISFVPKNKSFKRRIIWVGRLGNLLGKEIWMFCWKHDTEGERKKERKTEIGSDYQDTHVVLTA